MEKEDQNGVDHATSPMGESAKILWGIAYGVWMPWFLLSWACSIVFVVGGAWHEPKTWLWVASAFIATTFRWAFPSSVRSK